MFILTESSSSSQPSTPRTRSSHRSSESTSSKCSNCRHKCDNKASPGLDNQNDFDDDSGILNEILNEGEISGSENSGRIMHHSDSLSSGSDSGFYHSRGKNCFYTFSSSYEYKWKVVTKN